MTKKDYKIIADAVRKTPLAQFEEGAPLLDRDRLVYELCQAFEKDNPSFDQAKFVNAIEL